MIMRDLVAERTDRLRQLLDRSTEAEQLALFEGLAGGLLVAMTARANCAAVIARMRDELVSHVSAGMTEKPEMTGDIQ